MAGRIFGINSLTQESDVGKKIDTTRDSRREEAISFSCSEPSQAAKLDLSSIVGYLTKKKKNPTTTKKLFKREVGINHLWLEIPLSSDAVHTPLHGVADQTDS